MTKASKDKSVKNEEDMVVLNEVIDEWYMDYASYVVKDRAIPDVKDGLKPVHRRIMHTLNEKDDGRYHKVAGIVGATMSYHPHGDASIGDAMVTLAQKSGLLDCQGNWGNIFTGDRAAASRYIEVRLSPLARDIMFSKGNTKYVPSYDGRKTEPVYFPVKFPLLLLTGTDGIAVGMSTKILPHNFNELIDASINVLRKKKFSLLPDFVQGGQMDASLYDDGRRGGKIKIRAKIKKVGKDELEIEEIPYTTTTTSLIENIIAANEKGKIKIKKIEDNTAKNVSIRIVLPSGISQDSAIDGLYAFTTCQVSISPSCCVIEDRKPVYLSVTELLKKSVEQTKAVLLGELTAKLDGLIEKIYMTSLEKIFIEGKMYNKIEDCESWDEVLKVLHKALKSTGKKLGRTITDEDIERLTSIKIKKIAKYDIKKTDEIIKGLVSDKATVERDIKEITRYTIDFYKRLKKVHGSDRDRQTEVSEFETIDKAAVNLNTKEIYIDRDGGFVGYGVKSNEVIGKGSDLDDIICFASDGTFQVVRAGQKAYVGKKILHAAVWKKGDKTTIYNMVYTNTEDVTYVKRFYVDAITRAKKYNLAGDSEAAAVHWLEVTKDGEEDPTPVTVKLKKKKRLKKLEVDVDMADVLVKGRASRGNIVSKNAAQSAKAQK